ncbi:S26 family signal peptidase [Nitratireductor luteus]|uniref:S26 family signal peptidase n=1 Tax=Nitratireductor luteus TaxID=2976980 RepID=UPI00223EAB0F|nr:S26 family signal peptidase [Nitratireductor luteus]
MKKPAPLLLATALASASLVGFSAFAEPTPWFVWNASASAPVGLYRVLPGALRHGDLVLVYPPEGVAKLAAKRGYLPAGVPLIKRVVAMDGDRVCALRGTIFVNDAAIAYQRKADRAGRALPHWRGCRDLTKDELFLLMKTVPESFDSRYFGPVTSVHIIGRLTPLCTD